MTEIGDLYVELLQLREAIGSCSCGNATALGVIHSDTRPCYLPTIRMPLTDEQIIQLSKAPESDIEFAREIEKAHGIGGIREI